MDHKCHPILVASSTGRLDYARGATRQILYIIKCHLKLISLLKKILIIKIPIVLPVVSEPAINRSIIVLTNWVPDFCSSLIKLQIIVIELNELIYY